MATATMPTAAPATALTSSTTRPPLWPIPCEVIGASGEFASGKTLLGLTIAPGPATRVYDWEGSATPYKALGFVHVDAARAMLDAYPPSTFPNGVLPYHRLEWWLNDVRVNCPPGKYDVIMVDPISELEAGITDMVRRFPDKFGLSKAQIERGGGLFWGAVKDYQKSILDDLRARAQTFYFTAHMRDVFAGGSPTGKREAKGKDTLFELASLYLHLDRDAPLEGKDKGVQPVEPNAVVMKTRLTAIRMDGGKIDIVPVLPPRFTHCTPNRIRQYMVTPPDYAKLKKEEKLQERVFTEEEKLRLQLQVAEKNAETEQAALSRVELLRQAAATSAPAAPVNPDQSGQVVAGIQQKAQVAAANQPEKLSPERVQIVLDLAREIYANNPGDFVSLLTEYGAEKASELTAEDGKAVLTRMLAVRDQQAAARVANAEAPFDAPAQPAAEVDSIERTTTEQAAQNPASAIVKQMIKSDYVECFGDAERFAEWLHARGLYTIDAMTVEQANAAYADMKAMLLANHGPGIRKSQLDRIRSTAMEQLKLNEDELTAILSPYGVSSFRSLTAEQADHVLSELLARELGLKN